MGRGFGVAAGLDPEVARPLAARCAELGYDSIWSNDHPGAKGLETLAEFAAAAPAVDLGVAVIALDRTPPEEIAADIERLGLDPARLWLGVGAGFSEEAADADARVAAGAARGAARRPPRPRRDGPEDVRPRRRRVRRRLLQLDDPRVRRRRPREGRGRRRARPAATRPPVFGYVRTAVGPDAAERLAKEESFYRDLHDGYRNHFDRLGEPEGTVGVAAADRDDAQTPARRLRRPSTPIVVRGLACAKVEAMTAVAEAAAPTAS